MAKFFKLTKNSKLILEKADSFSFQKCTDGIAETWFLVWGSLDMWRHCIHNSQGPLSFSTIDDAVSFLLKRKIPLEKIDLKDISEV